MNCPKIPALTLLACTLYVLWLLGVAEVGRYKVGFVRSRTMVGKGADAEMQAVEVPCGKELKKPAMVLAPLGFRPLGPILKSCPLSNTLVVEVVDPAISIEAAAAVVDAIVAAAGGSAWLCIPS